jgi:hypothetical protein
VRSLQRSSALHEAGHVVGFIDGGLMPVSAWLDARGGFTRCTPPLDVSITEAEIVGALCGYYAEVQDAPRRRRLAKERASDDLEQVVVMVRAKHRHELARHIGRYRAKARRLVARRSSAIYALARELERFGRLDQAHAEEVLGALDRHPEAMRRLFRRWRRHDRTRRNAS